MTGDEMLQPDQMKVLVVEDEWLIRMDVAESFREAGLEVIEAASGEEAVQLLTAGFTPDVVFTDVRMPGAVDGLQLASHIRSELATTQVILTSGNEVQGISGVPLVRKPYDPGHVVEMICNLLGQHQGI